MKKVMLFGWTMEQWAIACAQFPLESDTHAAALDVRHRWMMSRLYQPGEEKIAGVEVKKDFAQVEKMLGLHWGVSDAAA